MKRYRWLSAKWPVSARALAQRMKAHPYSPQVSEGFIVNRIRDSHVEARLVERLEYQEVVTDPFGSENGVSRIEYRQQWFEIYNEFPQLMLTDPRRGASVLFNRLNELAHFAVTISPLAIDVMEWFNGLQRSLLKKGRVTFLQVAGLEVDTGVVAAFSLRGELDLRRALSKVTNGKRHILEKIHVQLGDNPADTIWLSRDGTARMHEGAPEDWLPELRACLTKAVIS